MGLGLLADGGVYLPRDFGKRQPFGVLDDEADGEMAARVGVATRAVCAVETERRRRGVLGRERLVIAESPLHPERNDEITSTGLFLCRRTSGPVGPEPHSVEPVRGAERGVEPGQRAVKTPFTAGTSAARNSVVGITV